MTLQEKLNQLGYYKIAIHYGKNNNLRVWVNFTEREDTFFEFDRNGNIVFERGTMFEDKRLSDSEKNNIIEIVMSENIPSQEDMYIRFGELPKEGLSKNFATGNYEKGISAFDARYVIGDAYFETCGNALVGAELVGLLSDKKIYLLKGEQIGIGSDGEPLLTNVEIIKELTHIGKGKYHLKSELSLKDKLKEAQKKAEKQNAEKAAEKADRQQEKQKSDINL